MRTPPRRSTTTSWSRPCSPCYFQNWNALPRCLENGVVHEQGSTAYGVYA